MLALYLKMIRCDNCLKISAFCNSCAVRFNLLVLAAHFDTKFPLSARCFLQKTVGIF